MPELRKDPITGRWVIMASDRGRRPNDFVLDQVRSDEAVPCAFCAGNEDKTPPEIAAFREEGSHPNTPGWKVRVVPNKFPALKIEGNLNKQGIGLYDAMNGVGAHEVIIESPRHVTNFADMETSEIREAMLMYKNRITDLMKDERIKYVLVFKNYGYAAGASLRHAHSQVIATPVTPVTIKTELKKAKEYYHGKDRCLFCDIIHQELMFGKERVALENDLFIALAPFASRFPFELAVFPKRHSHAFTTMDESEEWALADILKSLFTRLKDILNDPAYNFILHTAPKIDDRPGYWASIKNDFHWHLEIMPRLTPVAGFEWGTGFYINPTPPEDAAKYLRQWEIKKKEASYQQ